MSMNNDGLISEAEWKRRQEKEMKDAAKEEREFLKTAKFTRDGFLDPNEPGIPDYAKRARELIIEANRK